MIITHHREKLINAIIFFAQNTKYCGKTKLLKLLYFLDFKHFKQTGKPVTGLNYYAWEMGPVPKNFYEELSGKMRPDLRSAIRITGKEGGLQLIQAQQKFNNQYFSKRELRLLEELSFIFNEAKADMMVESTHLHNQPWDRTLKEKGKFAEIDYMRALDSDRTSLSHEQAGERLKERQEVYHLFGAD